MRSGAQLLIRSLDFAPIAAAQAAGDRDGLGAALNQEVLRLEQAGAGVTVLATNTMHNLAEPMMQGVSAPLVHIADATATAIRAAGLAPVLPDVADRAEIHRIIYDEFCRDVVAPTSRTMFEMIAARLATAGVDNLILGCTKVGMLLTQANVPVSVFDTLAIHCAAALDLALLE